MRGVSGPRGYIASGPSCVAEARAGYRNRKNKYMGEYKTKV